MSGILDALKAALEDYSQLIEKGSPLNNQYQQLKRNVDQHIPPQSAFRDPREMQKWALAAALNAPMRLSMVNKWDKMFEPPGGIPTYPRNNVPVGGDFSVGRTLTRAEQNKLIKELKSGWQEHSPMSGFKQKPPAKNSLYNEWDQAVR